MDGKTFRALMRIGMYRAIIESIEPGHYVNGERIHCEIQLDAPSCPAESFLEVIFLQEMSQCSMIY